MNTAPRLPVPVDAFRLATGVAAAALLVGLGMLLAYSAVEAIANPGYSLADGYSIGRLPWMGIIEGLVVAGATACILFGAGAILSLGGPRWRLAPLVPVALAGFWWFLAWGRVGILGGGPCVNCPAPAFDPWAYPYSAPQLAFVMLILPAVAIALLTRSTRYGGGVQPARGSAL